MNEEKVRRMLSMMCELGDNWLDSLSKEEIDDLVNRILTEQFLTFVPLQKY